MNGWDSFVMVDWASGNDQGPVPRKDAIWIGAVLDGREKKPVYQRNRQVAEDAIAELITREAGAARRLLIGFDFPFGYPVGFSARVVGRPDPLALWDWFGDNLSLVVLSIESMREKIFIVSTGSIKSWRRRRKICR